VRVGPLAENGMQCLVEPLYHNAVRIIARRGHPLAAARSLAELAEAEWVRTGGSDRTSLLPEAFRAAGLQPPQYRVECGSLYAVPEIVAQSDLLAVVPWQLAKREATAGHVAQLTLREALPTREICLCRRADLPLTPIAAEFAQIVRGAAQRLAARS
jgi:DNA-binding transcriptional LysR family regulator